MTILRVFYLKRNKLILITFLTIGTSFLVFDALFRAKWECFDEKLDQFYESRGKYIVLYNYVRANTFFGCKSAVTYCTHADLTTLESIKKIAKSYDGPISIAIYSPGENFLKISKIIGHLRSCYPEVKNLVTFHMIFDNNHFPTEASPLFKSYKELSTCNVKKETINENYTINSPYPINVLRNAAREAANTFFVLSVDLPLIPLKDFSSKFIQMATRLYRSLSKSFSPFVFVLPAFTIGEHVPIPGNKSVLGNILISGDADIYQYLKCGECHAVPQMSYRKWLQKGDFHTLGVAFIAKNAIGWQPFFVGTRSDPKFDERYLQIGIKDRQSQMYMMCAMDYNFLVLDNAYLTHRKNGEEDVEDVGDYKNYLESLNRDFLMIFGPNDKCYLN